MMRSPGEPRRSGGDALVMGASLDSIHASWVRAATNLRGAVSVDAAPRGPALLAAHREAVLME